MVLISLLQVFVAALALAVIFGPLAIALQSQKEDERDRIRRSCQMDVVTASAKQMKQLSTVAIKCPVCGNALSASDQADDALVSA
jgi:intracellular sulfur oxidation DsrE/DsrF family protein